MIKKEKNKSRFTIIGSLIIFGALSMFIFYHLYSNYINQLENKQAENFINSTIEEHSSTDTSEKIVEEKKEVKKEIYNYIGVLEIPKINFKRGFLEINDKNNTVNKNIQVLKDSTMPNIDNHLLIIAGHSGNGRTAFFKDIDKLKKKDKLYVYYENKKYIYEITKIYEEEKDGNISIGKNNYSTLVLTTCSQTDDDKQLVIISKYIDNTNY